MTAVDKCLKKINLQISLYTMWKSRKRCALPLFLNYKHLFDYHALPVLATELAQVIEYDPVTLETLGKVDMTTKIPGATECCPFLFRMVLYNIIKYTLEIDKLIGHLV